MLSSCARYLRHRRLQPLLNDQQAFYEGRLTPAEIRLWQLGQFNQQWQRIRAEVPFYRRISGMRNLPEQFSSWQQVQELLPTMTRKIVQTSGHELASQRKPPEYYRITGGSTAEPIQLPAWISEREFCSKDMWFARSWYDVVPSDKLFLIWGHRHLLGHGLRRLGNTINRRCRDALLGYSRFSAYDISDSRLRQAADALLKFRPHYILSYAAALDRFARVNIDRRREFHRLGMKVAVATTESYPRSDSAGVIADVLGCPVAMEYGAIETGPIAYQTGTGRFQAFWRHYVLELQPSEHVAGAYELRITTLYPRSFPLIRYEIGDLVIPCNKGDGPCLEFESVIGRSNDCLVLRNGSVVHPQAFRDAISWCKSVADFQIVQRLDGRITLRFVPARRPSGDDYAALRQHLTQVNEALEVIEFEEVAGLEQTVAGKTKRIIREIESSTSAAA